MSLSAFELLKMEFKDANFTIVCKAHSKDVFRKKGICEFIIDDGGKINLLKSIRNKHYDLGILFHNTLKDAVIFKLANIDKIIGYNNEGRKVFLDFYLKIDRARHYINHYANLVNSFLDNKYKTLPKIELYSKKSELLKEDSLKLVGFTLGSGKDSRSYPNKLTLELFELLKKLNIHVVLLGDINEAKSYKELEHKLKELKIKYTNISGKTTVGQLIDAISSLDVLITIDSSPLHIASGVGTKFITLLGKGTSAFDTVKPKVDFGTYLFEGQYIINDKDQISEIKPKLIANEIQKILHAS